MGKKEKNKEKITQLKLPKYQNQKTKIDDHYCECVFFSILPKKVKLHIAQFARSPRH